MAVSAIADQSASTGFSPNADRAQHHVERAASGRLSAASEPGSRRTFDAPCRQCTATSETLEATPPTTQAIDTIHSTTSRIDTRCLEACSA